MKASLANVVPSDKISAKGAKVTNNVNTDSDSRPIHLKLHPIVQQSDQTQNDSLEDEEGIKRICMFFLRKVKK